MATELKFLIDGADRGQPFNSDEFSIKITEDDTIGLRVVSYDNDLIFGGGVYSYLFDKLSMSGYCSLVNVTIQYKCKGTWLKLIDGYIIVTESVFNYDKCEVKTKIYDEAFSTRINNNKSIPFSMSITESKNFAPITPPAIRLLKMFNPADSEFWVDRGRAVSVYDAFKHLIACMSDGLIDFASDYLFTQPADPNDTLCLTNGANIRLELASDIVISFEQLYTNLRNKLNLGIGFEKQSNGRPLLRIEPIEYFFQTSPSANLYDQPAIELKFDTSKLYASVKFGNSPYLEANNSSSPSDPPQSLSFIQTPFRGFRDETFGFTGECNTSNVLPLETSELIFDTNTLEDIFRFNNDAYDTNNAIVTVKYFGGVTPYFYATKFDPYSIGQSVFNGNFTNLQVSNNWINGFPNSLFSFLEQPFDPTLTEASGRVNNDTQTWDVELDTPILFSTFTGNFVQFNTQTDPNDLFDGISYRCPFTGLYTINSELIYGFLEPSGATGGFNRRARLRLTHFDADDNFIQDVYGTLFADSGTTDVIIPATAQFVCNVGDILKVDAEVNYLDTGGEVISTQRILDTIVLDGVNRFSFVEFSGEPLLSPELDPVNIDDVRAYLYNFTRPLTMDEINSITSNTSNPILFGRKNDPLAVIAGYIKEVQIESVLRKQANFQLKSNLLLP